MLKTGDHGDCWYLVEDRQTWVTCKGHLDEHSSKTWFAMLMWYACAFKRWRWWRWSTTYYRLPVTAPILHVKVDAVKTWISWPTSRLSYLSDNYNPLLFILRIFESPLNSDWIELQKFWHTRIILLQMKASQHWNNDVTVKCVDFIFCHVTVLTMTPSRAIVEKLIVTERTDITASVGKSDTVLRDIPM